MTLVIGPVYVTVGAVGVTMVLMSSSLMNIELISIGRPLTPIAQDDSWVDHPQDSPRQAETPVTPPTQVTTPVIEDEDFVAQPTPSP